MKYFLAFLVLVMLSGCASTGRCGTIGGKRICVQKQMKSCDTLKGYIKAFNCKTAVLARAGMFTESN